MRGDYNTDPFRPILIWASPDYRAEDEALPIFRHDWDQLLEQCRRAVARREEAYPQLIARGQINGHVAAADIEGWKLLEAEWSWIISGEGEPPCPSTIGARIASVDLAIERVEAELARYPRNQWNQYQRHLLEALSWHLSRDRFGAPAIHQTARINHSLGRVRSCAPATHERSAA